MKKRIIIIGISIAILLIAYFLFKNKGNDSPGVSDKDGKISAANLIKYAKELDDKGDYVEEKNTYDKLINDFPNSSKMVDWQRKTEDLNIRLLFSPVITPGSMLYEIKPGDSLTKIAREFKTTTDLIKKSNNLVNDNIIPGKKVKVWTMPFNIFVDKSQNILLLKIGEDVFKSYIVSTGKNNCSPVGTFKIVNKLLNPAWYKAGAVVPANSPENILGTRWMGIDVPGYGIHGTTEPQSLGRQATQGCVRMSNPEVEELYTIIPEGTEVVIVD